MKKLIVTLFLLGHTVFSFSQNCDEEKSIILSGELEDYELEDTCVTNIKITTLDEDTLIKGITFMDAESVNILPTEGYKINIKPGSTVDFIDLYGAKDLRTRGRNQPSRKGGPITTTIYPNPVEAELNVQIGETIVRYKIADSFGVIYLGGINPINNKISVEILPAGLYFIYIETEYQIITKSFIKN